MDYIQLTVIGITILYVVTWLFQHVIEPRAVKRVIAQNVSPKIQGRIHFIENNLFHGINGRAISQRARHVHHLKQQEFIYGDIDPLGFYQLLKLADAMPEDTFYDLGCGIGKAVFTAALCADIRRCIGIELLPELFQAASHVLERFYQEAKHDPEWQSYKHTVMFMENNIFHVDFSDATLIFINATAFSTTQWYAVTEMLDRLPSGTRIIVTSHVLPRDRYMTLHEGSAVMSWGLVTCHIYQRR